jgi:hypothetical protein
LKEVCEREKKSLGLVFLKMDAKSTTIQGDLIKKILEFPYETLGIQKGGIYGDETFDKEGYLSDSNISTLRRMLIRYEIIGFELGNFGDYEVRYGTDSNNDISTFGTINLKLLKGSHVYIIYFDETGNCYGNCQITHLIPFKCQQGHKISWNEELFINPFVYWRPYDTSGFDEYNVGIGYKYHWKYRKGCRLDRCKDNKGSNNIDPSRIQTVLGCKKLIDIIINQPNISSNGEPKIGIYDIFSDITLAQVEECEKIEAEKN